MEQRRQVLCSARKPAQVAALSRFVSSKIRPNKRLQLSAYQRRKLVCEAAVFVVCLHSVPYRCLGLETAERVVFRWELEEEVSLHQSYEKRARLHASSMSFVMRIGSQSWHHVSTKPWWNSRLQIDRAEEFLTRLRRLAAPQRFSISLQ